MNCKAKQSDQPSVNLTEIRDLPLRFMCIALPSKLFSTCDNVSQGVVVNHISVITIFRNSTTDNTIAF